MLSIIALNVGRTPASSTQHAPATSVISVGASSGIYIRTHTIQHNYDNILRFRQGCPRELPGNNLLYNYSEAVDVAGVGASGRIEHLPSTETNWFGTEERVVACACERPSLGVSAVLCGIKGGGCSQPLLHKTR